MPSNINGYCMGSIRTEDGGHAGPGANWGFTKENTEWLHAIITLVNDKIRDSALEAVVYCYLP